jgi:hypothetical protein
VLVVRIFLWVVSSPILKDLSTARRGTAGVWA